jgi:predicted patatin/cPLA2 family phospholipase
VLQGGGQRQVFGAGGVEDVLEVAQVCAQVLVAAGLVGCFAGGVFDRREG